MGKEKRFEVIERESLNFSVGTIILRDRETGVCYLFVANGYGGGLTPLLDAEGKPIVDKPQ